LAFKVTELLIGIRMSKYGERLRRVHEPAISVLEMLALEIHVRENLRKLGLDGFCVDVDGQFLDHVDPSLGYWENKAVMDELLSGRKHLQNLGSVW